VVRGQHHVNGLSKGPAPKINSLIRPLDVTEVGIRYPKATGMLIVPKPRFTCGRFVGLAFRVTLDFQSRSFRILHTVVQHQISFGAAPISGGGGIGRVLLSECTSK
jgi:hypothetical protein